MMTVYNVFVEKPTLFLGDYGCVASCTCAFLQVVSNFH